MIKQLSEDIINQIAAGEVIEKPASIVRELLDNSIDAGSTAIRIEIDLNDNFSIVISDDGCGIPRAELPLAFKRYATSKINTFNDIYDIKHLGFRGEALASIAAIAEVTLISKIKEADSAYAIEIKGGEIIKEYPTSLNQGTKITVKNIFYNTPVRKKFLKNLIYEKQEIKKEIIVHILSTANIHFIYNSKKNNQTQQEINIHKNFTFKDKIATLYKQIPQDSLIEVEVERNGFFLQGYVTDQTYRAKSKKDQYLILKNRMIKNATFQAALQSCYINVLPSKTFPASFLKFITPSRFTDINVHPAKKEVKFQDSQVVYDFFYQNIKSILYQRIYQTQKSDIEDSLAKPAFTYNDQQQSHSFRKFAFKDIVQDIPSSTKQGMIQHQHGKQKSDEQNKGKEADSFYSPEKLDSLAIKQGENRFTLSKDKTKNLDLQTFEDSIQIFGQIAKCYLVFAIGKDLFIGDQHAIHERINFDMLNEAIEYNKKIERQALLIPLILHRNSQEIEMILMQQQQLSQFGIMISAFGKDAVKVNEVPSFFKEERVQQIINDILDKLCDNPNLKLTEFLEKITSTIACRMSIMSGDELSQREIRDLILTLYQKDYIHNCPHGRPFLKKISYSDLLAFFERSKHLPGM